MCGSEATWFSAGAGGVCPTSDGVTTCPKRKMSSPTPHPILTPTPIQEFFCDEIVKLGCRLFVKRDDLLPYSFGGNKVRIAFEFISNMHECGANALVMYGDLRSNLCRVLAMACYAESIPCMMVATTAFKESNSPSFNERIVRRLGVEVLLCEKQGIADTVKIAMEHLMTRGFTPYYIYGDSTGSGNEGVPVRAYVKAYDEICAWEREHDVVFDLIASPYGTGCTLAGLACGSLVTGDNREIVGISISSRPLSRALTVLDSEIHGWHLLEDRPIPLGYDAHLHLECGYNCGGYGKRDQRVNELIERMLATASLPLDPIYTGKALLGFFDYLRDHDMRGYNVLFIHTGGLPSFFDYLEESPCDIF